MGVPSLYLTSTFEPASGHYLLQLHNGSGDDLSGFRLGFSGPVRVAENTPVHGGTVVAELASWCEIAPPADFVLRPDGTWQVTIERLEFALRHWTDGVAGAVVTLADGSCAEVSVMPTTLGAPGGDERRSGVMSLPAGPPAEPWSIVPWPQRLSLSGAQAAPAGFAISAADPSARRAVTAFTRLAAALFPGWGIVRNAEDGGWPVRLAVCEGHGPEGYRLRFSDGAADLAASTQTGLLYGLITLGQLLRGARLRPGHFAFPAAGSVDDRPAFGWRGCHLDVARQFYGSGEIEQFLRVLAWNKLNRFHWHLSDDEGFRVQIDAFPQLAEVASWRGVGLPLPPLLGSPGRRSGGFYSKATIRALVAEAAMLGIEIVPEIDVPGHCHALLAALPQLRDPHETGRYHSIQGFPNNCLNPAVPAVYPVLETILAELCDLFPSRYVHVGADEVPEQAWSGSPLAQALLAERGGGGASVLQAHLLRRVQAMLTGFGRITGAWEEAAGGGGIDAANCYLVGWHTVAASQRLAAAGYDVVVSPGQAYYLDMANGPEWAEPGAHWAGWSSPEATYGFDPAAGWDGAQRSRLMGVQACIWSEPMTHRGVFERLVFPRLSAIAETGWTEPDRKNWKRFAGAAAALPTLYGIGEQQT